MKKLLSIFAFLYLIAFSNTTFANDTQWLSKDFWKTATPKTVQQKIDKGHNVNDRGILEWTPLMFANSYNSNPDVITILVKNGADIKAKDKDGKTALDYAKENPKIYKTDVYWQMNNLMYE